MIAISGSLGSRQCGMLELNLSQGKPRKSGKPGIVFLAGNAFSIIVFAPSLLLYIPNYFLGPSKTAGKNAKNPGNYWNSGLETGRSGKIV